MNTMTRLFLGSIIALVFAVLTPYSAEAKPIGGDPPCGECPNCCTVPPNTGKGIATSSPPGNFSAGAPIATINSTAGSGLDLSLSYNTYNADGSRAQLDIGLGYGWTHAYSSLLFSQSGHMFRYDGSGRVTRYQFLGNNTYRAAPGYFETLVRNPDGSFTITYKDGTAYRFARITGDTLLINGPVYHLTSVTDRNGNSTTLTYDGSGRLTQVTDVYGRSLTFAYNAQSHLDSVQDPLNRTTTFTYDSTGRRLATVTDPLGKTMQFSYNVLNQMTSRVDKDGRQFSFGYGNLKPVSVVDGAGNALFRLSNPNNWATDGTVLAQTQTLQYLPGTTTETDGRGNVWKYDYDLHGFVTKITAPDGATTQYTYDPATLLRASMTDANSHTTTYQYDTQGNLIQETDPLGHITAYQYEPVFNNVTQITYPNGSITQYQYDAHGNRTQEIRDVGVGGLNITTHWTYYTPFVPGNPSPVAGLVKTEEKTNVTPSGIVVQITRYEYDANGNRNKVTDPIGNVTLYQYDLVGNLTQMTDANGHVTTYAYDALNRLTQQTDPLGFMTQITYDGMGNRTQVNRQVTQAPNTFEVTQYQYDLRSRLVQEARDPAGLNLVTQTTYDGNNNRVTMTDPRGKLTKYNYDVQNRLSTVTDALGNVTQTQYDGVGNHTCVIDANLHYTFYEYDALNRQSRETRKIGPQSCTTADANDILTQTFYDVGNAIPPAVCNNSECAGPIPGSSSPAYRIDPETKYTYFKYDAIDRSVMTIRKVSDTADTCDSNDWCAITQYDSVGNVLARIDANGNATTTTYFDNNWLKSEANALNETTSYTYDGVGNVRTVHSPGGNVTRNVYDNRNELVQVADLVNGPGSLVARYAYDGIGNRTQQCDGNGLCTSYQYDAVNRLVATTDALAQATHYTYDPDSNLTQTVDRDGKAVCYVYDDINRRIRLVQKVSDTDCAAGSGDGDPDDVWTKTVYDKVGNVTELTTAKNNGQGTPAICNGGSPTPDCEATRYVYDEVNRLTQEAYPLRFAGDPVKNTREFFYDRASNLVQRIDQENLITFYSYNDLYYLTLRDYVTDPDDTFAYDVGGRMLEALSDDPNPLGVDWLVTFTYDPANRVVETTQDVDGAVNPKKVKYQYDTANRKRTLTYPGGKVVVEQRDLRERLGTLDDPGSPPPIATYAYDLGNRVTSRVYRNGTRAVYSYDADNRITDLNHTTSGSNLIAGFAHAYDNEGNKLFQQNHLDTNPTDCDQSHFPMDHYKCSEAYQYDDLYRIVHYKVGELNLGGDVPLPLTQTQYDLDKLGNWNDKKTTVDANPPVVQNRQHNAVNEITQIDAVPIAYDPDGNLIQDEQYFYEPYDQENRLTQVTQIAPSELAGQYRYDALSRRVAKITGPTRGNSETRYFYDDARIIEEQNTGGTTLATYTYGNYIDEVLIMERGGQTYYYHQNALWSVEAITDSTQTVVERYAYDAYGAATITNGSGNVLTNTWGTPHSAIQNPWLFTGRQLDEETGLYYYRSRYYDSGKGRFLQRDPLGYFEGINLYEYVADRSLFFVDPFGLASDTIHEENGAGTLDLYPTLCVLLILLYNKVFYPHKIAHP